MTVGMMHVRDVWVGVLHGLMFVKMGMRLAGRIDDAVGVTMVSIMHVRVRVSHRSMKVLMFMMLSHVQPHASRHKYSRGDELRRYRIAKCDDRSHAADEWRGRKVCAGARGAEAA